MKYAIIYQNQIIAEPQPWNQRIFNQIFASNGVVVSLSSVGITEPLNIAGICLTPVIEGDKPSIDPRIETLAQDVSMEGDVVSIAYSVQTRPIADIQAEQLALLKGRTQNAILSGAPDYAQRNAALGLLDPAETQAIKDHIVNCRTACNTAEAGIMAAVDVAWVVAVVDAVVWP